MTLGFPASPADASSYLSQWPFPFAARLTTRIAGATLTQTLEVENTDADADGGKTLEHGACFHTYLRVPDVEAAVVKGLGCVLSFCHCPILFIYID